MKNSSLLLILPLLTAVRQNRMNFLRKATIGIEKIFLLR